jgi:hypothetical protein
MYEALKYSLLEHIGVARAQKHTKIVFFLTDMWCKIHAAVT